MTPTLILLLLVALCLIGYVTYRFFPKKRETNTDVLISQTFSRILEGERDGVLEEVREIYARTKQDVGVGIALGTLLREIGKNTVAVRTHRSLTTRPELDPRTLALIHTEIAADYLASGLLDRARTALEEALALRKPDAHMVRCGQKIYTSLRDWDAAFKLLTQYGKAEDVDVKERLALLRFHQAEQMLEEDEPDLDEARSILKKATSIDPNCIPAYILHAQVLAQMGKPEKGRQLLQKHEDIFGDQAWVALECHRLLTTVDGRGDLMTEAAERILSHAHSDWRARAVLGTYLTEIGEFENAATHLLLCLESAPQVLLLHQKLWSLMLRTNDMVLLTKYRDQVKEELVFGKPYQCKACGYNVAEVQWQCPSCDRTYSFNERRI